MNGLIWFLVHKVVFIKEDLVVIIKLYCAKDYNVDHQIKE